jgi:cytochrome P450
MSTVDDHTQDYDLSTYNPFGPHLTVMYDYLDYARQTTPVFFSEAIQAWCVTTYDDVKMIASDPVSFSSMGVFPKPTGLHPEAQRAIDFLFEHANITMLDPPDHEPVRRIAHQGFGPRPIAMFEPSVREIITRFVDQLPMSGRFDLAADFSDRATLAVAMKVIGFAESDHERLHKWVHDAITLGFNHQNLSTEQQGEIGKNLNAGYDYAFELIDDRLASSRNDLISFMLHNTVRERRLARNEVANLAMGLVAAGWHTTGGAITNMVAVLLEVPDRWTALAKGDLIVEDVVTEGLRYDTSTIGFFRTVLRDVVVGGVNISRGERIFLSYAAANHDPAKFQGPGEFNPERTDSAQLMNFGHGIHYCVGAPLAKLEMEISLELLARRYPSLRLDEPPRYKPFSQFKTPESMWVVPT